MTKSTLPYLFGAVAGLLLCLPVARAETPETILIRRTLANDLSGYRRADAELVLSSYHQEFSALQGNGNADPRAWSILYEDRESFARDLSQKLAADRYETERTLPFIYVRGQQAMVTSLDSGQVVDRQNSTVTQIKLRRFWTLRKVEEDWLVTGLVEDLGDSALAVPSAGAQVTEILEVLQREEQGWESGSPGAIAGLFDENFIGYDAYGTLKPETWKIVFSNAEELEKWLDRRLQYTAYRIDREVVFSAVGAGRRQALAVTREQVETTHQKGSAVHRAERYVLWTFSRQSGEWKITNLCYSIGLPLPSTLSAQAELSP